MIVWAALAACTGGVLEPNPPDDDDDAPSTPTYPAVTDTPTTATGDTSPSTGDTAPPAPDPCAELPMGPFNFISSGMVHTEEDFDFDATGLLVMQSFNNLVGISRTGDVSVLATSVGADIAGVRSLPTGDFIVAQQDTGAVRRVNASNGSTQTVFGGLDFPNGLDAGLDGYAYVSEYANNGHVRMFDPYSGTNQVILDIDFPNGLALSPDEQTLYVAISDTLFWGDGRIVAIDRDPTGAWVNQPRLVYSADDLLDALTVDVCGNVYAAEYNSGQIVRIRTDGTVDQIVDLPNSVFEGFCAMRFGAGYDGWERNILYVSNRSNLYAIEIGIDGRHVLATTP